MDTTLWILQGLLAISFGYSGLMKATRRREYLVSIGQTGIADLPYSVIRFIGITELLGVAGIILPWALNIFPVLTPITAICFAVIMVLAAPIHYRRHEFRSVGVNIGIFIVSVVVAYCRWRMLPF